MIDIKEKNKCTGCNACLDICPKQSINLKTDIEGFWYPIVDRNSCIDCGLCEHTCPIINIDELKKNEFEEPVCFAAIHKDIEVRFGSTTGGMFSALAQQMYKDGGYVAGAIYTDDFTVKHFISNDPKDLIRLRQSKYSQSNTVGIYKEVKRLLNAGEKVLICGTPCQMSALRRFLNKDYEDLIIIDFICKSITSPKFYAKYLDYWERKTGSKLVSFKFKDKELGWRRLVKRFNFKNGKTLYSRAIDNDLYSSAYHHNIVSRPSCYDCQFKGSPRISDITIADFWGCENYTEFKSLDDDAGTSAVMCNNSKGLNYFNRIKNIETIPAKLEQFKPGNPALYHKQDAPKCDRAAFFEDLDKLPIEDVVTKHTNLLGNPYTQVSLKWKLKMILKIGYQVWKCSNHSLSICLKTLLLNLSSKVKTDWKRNGIIYLTPYSIVELQDNSILELHGPFIIGAKKVQKSHEETRLLIERNGKMIVEERFNLMYGSDIEVFSNAILKIGNCGTNYNCTIICGKSIELRGRVSLGRDVNIRDTNAHLIAIEGYKVLRPVLIETHTWLCSGATICPGVKVKTGAIVGANSYVIQNVPAHSLVSGHPAKIIMNNIAWKL